MSQEDTDERVEFLARNINSCCYGSTNETDRTKIILNECYKSKEMRQFLDGLSVNILKAIVSLTSNEILFSLDISSLSKNLDSNDIKQIFFVKRGPLLITSSNMNKTISIYSSLGSDNDLSANIAKFRNVSKLLSEGEFSNRDIDNFSNIMEPADEISFWSQLKSQKTKYRNLAKKVDESLLEIGNPGYNDLYSMDFDAAKELIDRTFDALNNCWNIDSNETDGEKFPQNRMINFFDVISNAIIKYCQLKFESVDLWNSKIGEIRTKLQVLISLCQQWINIPKKLIGIFWKKSWKGQEYDISFIQGFKSRLDQILEIRGSAYELSQLLSSDEQESLRITTLFKPFEETHPIHFNPETDSKWKRALSLYWKAIEPIEIAVIAQFRKDMAPLLDNPLVLLREFQKYSSCMHKTNVRNQLISERESLLTLLVDIIKKMETAVDRIESTKEDESLLKVKLLSPRVASIVYLRQICSKVSSIVSSSSIILNDLNGFKKFEDQCHTLMKHIKNQEDSRFNSWVAEYLQKIEANDSSMTLQGSPMTWKHGVLTVNFPEDLVRFLREVRQLDELGFEFPKASSSHRKEKIGIIEKATEIEKFYRYGILLMKTANFYNSLSEQMVDVQEELLLSSLDKFSKIIDQSNSNVSWSNPVQCESYIQKVQEATETLSSENRWLRKIHEWLINETISLMNIDLLKQTDNWKLKWKSIKDKVSSIRTKYSEKDSKQWLLHWDHQIYKALEASYKMGLESLSENLPELKIEIVFVNRNLEFKPPIEQIRQSYYHEMKKFIGIPNSFEGFGNVHIYRKMCSINSKQIVGVYEKAEVIFDKLTNLIQKYLPLIRLCQVDLDQFIEQYCIDMNDFNANFKILKLKKKEIEKLFDVEKIDCFTISLTPLKVYLDDFMHQVNEGLLIGLRRLILSEFKEIDQYLEFSNEKLRTRPKSVNEIGVAKKQWKEIEVKKDSMKSLSRSCVDKKKLLLQYSPGTNIDISKVISRMSNLEGEGGRWDDFDIALEAFNDMIEEQKEILKATLEEDIITLNIHIDKFTSRWNQLKPGNTEVKSWEKDEIEKIFTSLEDWGQQFQDLQMKANELVDAFTSFGLTKPQFENLDIILQDYQSISNSWNLLKDYTQELKGFADQDWLAFSSNIYPLQDFATKWLEILKNTSYAKGSDDSVANYIYSQANKLKNSFKTLSYCRGEAFKEDHWIELLQGKLNLSREVQRESLKVEHFLSRLDIIMDPNTLTFVKNLQSRALGEVQIREALQELRAWERSADIKLLPMEESNRKLPLIKEWRDLFIEMGDKQSLLASLKESQFYKAFADQGNILEGKMATLDFVMHTLNTIQRKWVYLEPIFSRGSLPAEESRFRRVDEDFSDIMISISKDTKLFSLLDIPQLSDKLKTMLDQLERCQKALTEFLEAKRSAMPRFYFIGDDDLLEILGQAKNPMVVQSHLKKLFQGIHKVKFNSDFSKITAMISSVGEEVELDNPISISDKVEDWIHHLATEMRKTLASLLVTCLRSKSLQWHFPYQILSLTQCIRFTEDAEKAIENGSNALLNLEKNLRNTLRDLTSHDLSGEPLLQLKMKNLVFDIVHHIDVVQQLKKHKVDNTKNWYWKKQLRYYLEKNQVVVKMYDATFEYTYEYQGNAPKLVHTPLTDKCYLTLTQGMKMGFGGNPYGPAGTGKTESVKALAQCMGRQVLVFNCDEALESASMVRIFMGIVKCGAWGCFDEFNRLKEDQLSAISQQIQVIQDAIKNKTSPITLLDVSVDVNFNSGIFVTLNPAGKGYGGRSRLPDNLKALFRPVAMGAPDNELIAEVSLVTEGFTQAKDLASKIVSLFNLSKQLLSQQLHYDWGLRALKAVLNSGGRIMQNYKNQGIEVSSKLEYEILIKAVRVNVLSKLTFSDTSKFLSLIGDVYPGVHSSDISGGELEESIKIVLKEKPLLLIEDQNQIKKMIQLKESLDQRMGCVIVGPSGSGKSVLWKVLKSALVKCGRSVVTHVINPKSMPRDRLLGRMDVDTREWFDGVLTDAARKVVRESSDVSCWIICDGDVDPEWIESLNSVLDDNHLLTLPNGERISFGSNVNFIFETHSLSYASPATVSRMGMIFLSDEDLDIKRLVQRWISIFPQEKQTSLSSWIDELFYKALEYVLRMDFVVDTTLVGTVINGLSQVRDASSRQEFICGLIRGIGGNLNIQQRIGLAKEVFNIASERLPDINAPLDCYAQGSLFYSFKPPLLREDILVRDIGDTVVIPTVSLQRTCATLESWINHSDPFILVGPEGCGKSLMIYHAFRQRRGVNITTLHCNAQTSSDDIINKIIQTCALFSSSDGRVYRPKDCERLVLFLKDINLPRPDKYETCQLIAFLQQIITFEGFYDSNLEFLRLERIQIVCSMNAATTVGRHALSPRFTAITRLCVVDYPETSELLSVYDNFLGAVLKSLSLVDRKWLNTTERERLVSVMIEIYQKTKEKFTVDDHRHYLFTPRDLTKWVKNLCRYDGSHEDLLDIFVHEANRIFRDGLVGVDHLLKFDQLIAGILRTHYKYTAPPHLASSFYTSLENGRSIGLSSNESKESEDSVNDNIGRSLRRITHDEFKKMLSQGILYYEREERDLNILLYQEMLENIVHIDRILSSIRGHALLVGKCGVGRRQATTIASYLLGYEFHTLNISKTYSYKQFLIDLKAVLYVAGVKGEHSVLFVEDFHLISESFLEVINSLLSSGEVPGMYSNEELDPLLAQLREKAREDGNFKSPYDFFISRINKYLHIVICMDSTHSSFLYRCESNPALYSQCNVLWMAEFQKATLQSIPLLLDGVNSLVLGKENIHDNMGSFDSKGNSKAESKGESKVNDESDGLLLEMIQSIHSSCIPYGGTPKDYLTFLQSWLLLFSEKKVEVTNELNHLQAGLSKLESAAAIVNDLRTNAKQQEIDLRNAQAAADRAMDEISKALTGATERRREVGDIKHTVSLNEIETQKRKEAIEEELADIQPILDRAKEAVGGITPTHLNEIRSLTAPPEPVADVLAAVLMMLGVQDLSWLSMKKFLGNRGVKDDILNFDARAMSNDLRMNVAKIIKKKSSSFDDATIRRASLAAAPLAAWVKANIRYSLVLEKIEPLQNELDLEIDKLTKSQQRLKVCEDELLEIDDRVNKLKSEFGERTAEAERLKRNLAIAGSTLDKAEKLIGQLGGEQVRWKAQVKQLKDDLLKLPIKMLLAAGFSTYLAKEAEDVRGSMIKRWVQGTGEVVSAFSFTRIMSSESKLLEWKAMGLPSDDLSLENGLVISSTAGTRIPFIIDPTSAATNWLKSYLSKDKSRPLEVVSSHDPRFVNQVELAVRFGKTLVILEAETVDPMLYPLCRKDLNRQGARLAVRIGDKIVDYNENFRMYLVTRNPQPLLPPDACTLVTQINFSVTRSGLEGQLLALAIQHEKPEIEEQKSAMLKKEEDFKVQLASFEKNLLEALATSEGNILEDTSLIESLSNTKRKVAEIEEALGKSAEMSIKLDEQRELYRSFAVKGAKLFFIVKGLYLVSHMYQFSLLSFLNLFKRSLAATTSPSNSSKSSIDEHIQKLSSDLEVRILYFIGQAIFKSSRLMFALHLVHGMHPDYFGPKEWEIFTGSLVSSNAVKENGLPKLFPSWASSDRQDAFSTLLEHLPQLVNSLELDNLNKWNRFSTSLEAERDFPSLSVRNITPFQKVLVIQVFRPDRLQSALMNFCTDFLRVDSISPPPFSFPNLLAESSHDHPILILSSPGADPSKELEEFASKTIGNGQYLELAMGGGQQDLAVSLIRDAAVQGTWLCLKNLHLVVAWLPTLQKVLSSIDHPHEDFRLWLTSEQHDSFPSILLQQSLKVTYEAPPGIKKNLQRTLDSWNTTNPDDSKEDAILGVHAPMKSRLLFLLAVFHAVLQERRNFIPQGWNKYYEFSYGDLRAGFYVIEAAVKEMTKDNVDWEAIHGLMEDAIYGGRIEKSEDQKVLRAYLSSFFNDSLVLEQSSGKEIISGTPLRMPKTLDFAAFLKIVSQLPDTDAPYFFGLPDNVERSLQRTISSNVIKQLRALSICSDDVFRYDKEKWKAQLTPILELWQQLSSSNNNIINKKTRDMTVGLNSKKGPIDPVDDFIIMEFDLAGNICLLIDSSLNALKKVLFGSGLLTPSIQAIASALLSGSIPIEWIKLWEYGPEKPQSWIREVVRKRICLTKYKGLSSRNELLSEPVGLGDVFNPATFVNALRQQSARKLGVAIDRMKMISSWSKDSKELQSQKCPLICTLANLLLQGALFHNSSLVESTPEVSEIMSAPLVQIGFTSNEDTKEVSSVRSDMNVSIPVYYNPSREQFLMELLVPGNGDSDKWILAGTALFLSEDE